MNLLRISTINLVKKALVLCISASATMHVLAGDSEQLPCLRGHAPMLYQSSWHMMEDIFITQPEEKITRILGMGGLIGLGSLAAGMGMYFGVHKGIRYLNGQRVNQNGFVQPLQPPYPFLDSRKNIIATASGIATGLTFYSTVKSLLLEREAIQQLERLLKQWPDAKELCPRELHAPLQSLLASKDTLTYPTQLRETARLVKASIRSHFPEKYAASKGFFRQGRLNFNVNLDLTRVFDRLYNFFMG